MISIMMDKETFLCLKKIMIRMTLEYIDVDRELAKFYAGQARRIDEQFYKYFGKKENKN